MNSRDYIKTKVAWNALRASRYDWELSEYRAEITRQFYLVISSINNNLNIMSENAVQSDDKHEKHEKDHFFPPQTICRIIMDDYNLQDKYLKHFDAFKDLIQLITKTIVVTKEENKLLRRQTKNSNGVLYQQQSLIEKYDSAGIVLHDGAEGQIDFPFVLPDDILECEKKYIKPEKF